MVNSNAVMQDILTRIGSTRVELAHSCDLRSYRQAFSLNAFPHFPHYGVIVDLPQKSLDSLFKPHLIEHQCAAADSLRVERERFKTTNSIDNCIRSLLVEENAGCRAGISGSGRLIHSDDGFQGSAARKRDDWLAGSMRFQR